MLVQDCGSTGNCCSVRDKETLMVTLTQTAQLFRPYLSWKLQTGADAAVTVSEGAVGTLSNGGITHQDTSSIHQVTSSTPHHDVSSTPHPDILSMHQDTSSTQHHDVSSQDVLSTHQDTSSTHQGTTLWDSQSCGGAAHQDTPSTACCDTISTAHQDATSIAHQGNSCTSDSLCIFSSICVSQDPSLYIPTFQKLVVKCHTLHKLVPSLDLPLCCCHSPFVMLVRQLLHPDGFTALVDMLHQKACLSNVAHQLWASVYAMAECSCLVWAR